MYLIYLWHLRHALTYIGFDGMVRKLSVSAFQNFFRIENPLSIKEVMSQNVCVCSFPIFDVSDIHSITALMCIWSIFDMSHTLYSVRITMEIVIQCLWITVKFDLNPWFTLNYNRIRTKTSNYRHFELANS